MRTLHLPTGCHVHSIITVTGTSPNYRDIQCTELQYNANLDTLLESEGGMEKGQKVLSEASDKCFRPFFRPTRDSEYVARKLYDCTNNIVWLTATFWTCHQVVRNSSRTSSGLISSHTEIFLMSM
ncbi:hypothetical protein Bpfe_009648 [Biomphalaria pfeifferi]|uniref:Uncharacterized protein n=1 Tax=Biomphalaria pfeifferi TaxID=112525 RepID=A0AAD8BTY3_BIOPF|nr:hypothetical protein Bpfe_009648 [Biomphalaria pfeifferi]